MDAVNSQSMNDLITARRLLLYARQNDSTHKLKNQKHQTAKEAMEEDQAILSGKMPGQDTCSCGKSADDDLQINLNDLIKQLSQIRTQSGPQDQLPTGMTFEATTVEVTTTVEEEFSFQYSTLERVDGLVVRNKNLAETDRYAFEFSDGTTLKIIDKWSGKSTSIWGDPHIDVSDVQGNLDGDFQDLTESNTHTTFMLQDGTRLTITAKDSGIIEAVDIYKDSQHVTGLGAGTVTFNDKTGLFSTKVDTGTFSSVPTGDVIYAGGDGNDWYDAAHHLVWGKTTGPSITSRPSSILTMEYRYRMEQQVSINHVEINT